MTHLSAADSMVGEAISLGQISGIPPHQTSQISSDSTSSAEGTPVALGNVLQNNSKANKSDIVKSVFSRLGSTIVGTLAVVLATSLTSQSKEHAEELKNDDGEPTSALGDIDAQSIDQSALNEVEAGQRFMSINADNLFEGIGEADIDPDTTYGITSSDQAHTSQAQENNNFSQTGEQIAVGNGDTGAYGTGNYVVATPNISDPSQAIASMDQNDVVNTINISFSYTGGGAVQTSPALENSPIVDEQVETGNDTITEETTVVDNSEEPVVTEDNSEEPVVTEDNSEEPVVTEDISEEPVASEPETITGTHSNDIIIAKDGNDTIDAQGGDDVIITGKGANEVFGGEGNDTVDYSRSDAGVTLDIATNTATGGFAEGDSFDSIENLVGSNHNDTLTGDDKSNVISGGTGDDKIYGGGAKDYLSGGKGADFIDGQDNLEDVAEYVGSDAGVEVSLITNSGKGGDAEGDILANIEFLHGSLHDDWLQGDELNNRLEGRLGDDTLLGESGNDTLLGGYGADILNGGEGSDTANYNWSDSGVNVNLLDGSASGGEANGDTFISIENLFGSLHDDTLTGDDLNNRLNGSAGDDQLFGGDGNDSLIGGEGADHLDGGAGTADTADYADATQAVGVDLINGGFQGEADGDTYANIEYVAGSAWDDTIIGDEATNRLYGNDGNDALFGGDGNDFLVGGNGSDILDGGAGSRDVADYSEALEGVGVDLINGGFAGEAMGDSYTNIEYIYGSSSNDALLGNDEVNRLVGGEGQDLLMGRDGNDYLFGGEGDDFLNGGQGDDVFLFYSDNGFDTMLNFEAGAGRTDRIWLKEHDFNDFGDLQHSLTDTIQGAVLEYSQGTIFFEGLAAADLVADDFIL